MVVLLAYLFLLVMVIVNGVLYFVPNEVLGAWANGRFPLFVFTVIVVVIATKVIAREKGL